jgi:uncharacterized protein YgbK (DUF1537 family)
MPMEPLILVIDDDPTGIQTVHNVRVCMTWSPELLTDLFRHEHLVFVQTNNRARPEAEAVQICQLIVEYAIQASRKTNRGFRVISRGDSTLRGHYPAEPQAIRQALNEGGLPVDGEVLCFFLAEAGRITLNNHHYIRQSDGNLIPVSNTEFARDAVFGYQNADITRYVEEKTAGRIQANTVRSLPLDWLEAEDVDRCTDQLMHLHDGMPLVINATAQRHIEVAVQAIRQAERQGKQFVFRTAAAFVKAYGSITDHPLLTKADLQSHLTDGFLLTIVGSHTENTNRQLAELLKEAQTFPIELDVAGLQSNPDQVLRNATHSLHNAIASGRQPVVFTSRVVQKAHSGEANLALSRQIAVALSGLLAALPTRPRAVIAKGGITSSVVITVGLGVDSALVLGQIRPSIPVILGDAGSRFAQLPVVIFPGNTGDPDDLRTCWQLLS